MYYDKQGNPLSSTEVNSLLEDREYRTVGRDKLQDGTVVSTVWLGIDHSLGSKEPVIFETMVFNPAGESLDCRRYCTEAEALEGHQQAVAAWKLIVG